MARILRAFGLVVDVSPFSGLESLYADTPERCQLAIRWWHSRWGWKPMRGLSPANLVRHTLSERAELGALVQASAAGAFWKGGAGFIHEIAGATGAAQAIF